MAGPDQKYRIIDKLDAGGMAEIYRAEAELVHGMKKKVAIKRILPHLTRNEKFVSMFLDEARLSLYLDHANIVHVFDIGRSGNTYFLVMEYVEGLNLRQLTQGLHRLGKPIAAEHSLFIMMEVCKGLGYAHDMTNPEDGRHLGIVHRDISPPNILISRNGEVKIVDFGLAKAASQVEQTDPGVVKGKFSYLSPEAARGEEVDHRADIFACGIILFELLTGRRLFYGETDFQTVQLVREANIPSLSDINPAVPRDLDAIVRKALARAPEQRFQHAYELQDALAHFLFERGLKVTSRDIAQLVRRVRNERARTIPPARSQRTQGVIDALIQEEIVKFTSLESADFEDFAGAKPLSPDELSGSGPLDPGDFIDTRQWTEEVRTGTTIPPGGIPAQDVPSIEEILDDDRTEETTRPEAPAAAATARGLRVAIYAAVAVGLIGAVAYALVALGVLGR